MAPCQLNLMDPFCLFVVRPVHNFQVKLELEKEQKFTVEGYFQFLGYENVTRVGHKLDHFIASCEVHIWEGSSLSFKPCGNLVNFTKVGGLHKCT